MAEITECQTCGSVVPAEAAECPKCGEPFEPALVDLQGLADLKPEASDSQGFRGRILFYVGLAMVLLGGPGIALGSWLHDLLRIPIGGDAYSVFGSYNRTVSAVGLVVLVVGIVLIILALRLSRPGAEDYDVGARREKKARS